MSDAKRIEQVALSEAQAEARADVSPKRPPPPKRPWTVPQMLAAITMVAIGVWLVADRCALNRITWISNGYGRCAFLAKCNDWNRRSWFLTGAGSDSCKAYRDPHPHAQPTRDEINF